ncbi:hypothetical protein QBC32DRAFT_334116 [Pseudoneurospora amorphoporcata]|uniref:Uncharacterized protein n=1 Tax=Pseudoneurospora amorphoporcata TaxID=241081 RepID=A0AAN6SI45_9PEZI|nr:hypothetical protein QBC32DRAFT_334116 [Pseudoneurospora amorphoporcata]
MKQVVMVDPNVHPLFQALFVTPRTLKYGLRRKWKQSVSFRRIDLHQMPHGDQYIVGLKGPMLLAGLRCGIVVPLFRSSRSDVPYRPVGQSRTQTETVPHVMNERGRSRMSRTILSTSRDPGLSVAGGGKAWFGERVGQQTDDRWDRAGARPDPRNLGSCETKCPFGDTDNLGQHCYWYALSSVDPFGAIGRDRNCGPKKGPTKNGSWHVDRFWEWKKATWKRGLKSHVVGMNRCLTESSDVVGYRSLTILRVVTWCSNLTGCQGWGDFRATETISQRKTMLRYRRSRNMGYSPPKS